MLEHLLANELSSCCSMTLELTSFISLSTFHLLTCINTIWFLLFYSVCSINWSPPRMDERLTTKSRWFIENVWCSWVKWFICGGHWESFASSNKSCMCVAIFENGYCHRTEKLKRGKYLRLLIGGYIIKWSCKFRRLSKENTHPNWLWFFFNRISFQQIKKPDIYTNNFHDFLLQLK